MLNHAILALRLIALTGVLYHLAELLANLIQAYDTLKPAYIGYFLKQTTVRPLVGILIFSLTGFLSARIARWIVKSPGKD